MPLELDNPSTVTIQTVRIANFACTAQPLTCRIEYEIGTTDAQGVFTVIKVGSAVFEQDQIAIVDPDGSIYGSMKEALYGLLKTVVGSGTVG